MARKRASIGPYGTARSWQQERRAMSPLPKQDQVDPARQRGKRTRSLMRFLRVDPGHQRPSRAVGATVRDWRSAIRCDAMRARFRSGSRAGVSLTAGETGENR